MVLGSISKTAVAGDRPKIIMADREVGDFVAAMTRQWVSPKSEKEALEFRALVAELDYRNYSSVLDPTSGKQVSEFACPPDIAEAIATFRQKAHGPYRR